MGEVLKVFILFIILTFILSGIALIFIIKGYFQYIISKNMLEARIVNNPTINEDSKVQSNGWLRLAVFSFIGILLLSVVMTITNQSSRMSINTLDTQPYLIMHPSKLGHTNKLSIINTNYPKNSMRFDDIMIMHRINQLEQEIKMMQIQINMNNLSNMPSGLETRANLNVI